jgi:hypothetical protein
MAADYPAVMSACGAFGITCKVNIDKNFLIQIIRQKMRLHQEEWVNFIAL